MIHKQIYNSSYFSTAGRISRGIFIERILLTTVLFLLTYLMLLHYSGEIKTLYFVYEDYLARYVLMSLWLILFLIQYIKRIHDCNLSFIESLKNPFVILIKGTYGPNKYGLLSNDIYYIKGVKDFNKDEFLAYQKKGNRRAFRSLFLLFSAIIMILVLSTYNPSITRPHEGITTTRDSTIHSFSDTLVIDRILKNKDTLITGKVYDTTFTLTIIKNGNNEVVNTKRTFSKLDSTVIKTTGFYIPPHKPPQSDTLKKANNNGGKTYSNGGTKKVRAGKGKKNHKPRNTSFQDKFN